MSPYFKAFLTVLSTIVLGVALAVLMTGSAAAPVKVESPVVSAFVFLDRCDASFVEAAFVHSDGTITEVDDIAKAKALDGPVKDANGRVVPIYTGECKTSL